MLTAMVSRPPNEGMTRMNLNVDSDLHRRFKAAVSLQGKDMTTVVVDLMRSYVAQHERPAAPKKKRTQ